MIELSNDEIEAVTGGVAICNNVSSCLSLAVNIAVLAQTASNALSSAAANSGTQDASHVNAMGDTY